MVFNFLVKLLNADGEHGTLFVGFGFHALQGPAVVIDGHCATKTLEGAAAHGVERNHVERVAVPDGCDALQSEEIVPFAAPTNRVNVFSASHIDGFVVEADALHTVHQIDESRVFHAGHLRAEHVL